MTKKAPDWAGLAVRYLTETRRKIIAFNGDHYEWNGSYWTKMNDGQLDNVKKELRKWLSRTISSSTSNTYASNVWGALQGEVYHRPIDEGTLNGKPAPDYVAVKNGLLHIPSRTLQPPTPDYFSTFGLTFPFVERASAPVYEKFLSEVLPDQAAQDLWHEFAGYALLTTRTDLHHFLILQGETRSGKGTLMRILEGMSEGHYAAPRLEQIINRFAMASLDGKRILCVPDSTLDFSDYERNKIVDFVLSLTGEDAQSVEAKFKDAEAKRLFSRLFIQSNNAFMVHSGHAAFAARRLILCFLRSFKENADTTLGARLKPEYPQILHYFLDGLERLNTNNGRFTVPESSRLEALRIKNESNPLYHFVEECLEFDDTVATPTNDVRQAYVVWCGTQGVSPISPKSFGSAMKMLLEVDSSRAPGGRKVIGEQGNNRLYLGVRLRECVVV